MCGSAGMGPLATMLLVFLRSVQPEGLPQARADTHKIGKLSDAQSARVVLENRFMDCHSRDVRCATQLQPLGPVTCALGYVAAKLSSV